MSYKDVDAIRDITEERRARVISEMLQAQAMTSSEDETCTINSTDIEQQAMERFESTFCLSKFMKDHPSMTFESFTNFSSDELDELVILINNKLGYSRRGKKIKVSTKGCIFLTLAYYSSYMPLTNLAEIMNIKVPTLERIIRKVTNTYFPIFIWKFIPKSIPTCKTQFTNYPSAVGAVDSTTIKFYQPSSKTLKQKSWDGKNKVNGIKLQALVNPAGIAIHICTDYLGATHDKKLFDLSEVTAFVTVKRGVELIPLPVLADRGYVGIEKYHTSAIVQQKGDDEETKKRNNFIAVDRQIVERFFGRFKMSWGVMADGFRGDRETIPTIIKGLIALTNYNISLHPLTKDDSATISEPNKASTYEDEAKNAVQLSLKVPIEPRNSGVKYSLEVSEQFIGIKNQGSTCHLNAVLQTIFMINPFVKIITESNINASPSQELAAIFHQMIVCQHNQNACDHVIFTKELTRSLGRKWLSMQDPIDTFEFLMKKISENLTIMKSDDNITDIFGIRFIVQHKITKKQYTENWLSLSLYIQYEDVYEALEMQIFSMEKFYPPPILVIQTCRPRETAEFKCHMKRYSFSLTLDLSNISNNNNKHYELFSIIAYASLHTITFNKINDQWYVFDDENVYTCDEEMISCLYGGEESNSLWEHTQGLKWTAKILFYREIHYNIFRQ